MAKKKQEGTDILSDIFGAGDVGAAIAEGIADTQQRILSAEETRYVERQKNERARISAAKDIVGIQQSAFTKRHQTVGETVQTWINESDEILNALDRPFYKTRWKKGRRTHELKVSAMTLCALGPLIEAFGSQHDLPVLHGAGNRYERRFAELVSHAEEMNRTANAGDLNFAIPPEVPGLIDQGIYQQPQGLTGPEIEALVNKAIEGQLDQFKGGGQWYEEDPLPPPDLALPGTEQLTMENIRLQIANKESMIVRIMEAIRRNPLDRLMTKQHNITRLRREITVLKTQLTALEKQAMKGVEGAKSR